MIFQSPSGEKFVIYRLGDTLAQITEEITDLALENNGHNVAQTAAALGINRTTLRERLKARFKIPKGQEYDPLIHRK